MTRPYVRGSDAERLAFYTSPEPNTGCWLWAAAAADTGYGVIRLRGRNLGAHRVAYAVHRGPVGNRMVLHSCDNRTCVNPDHLFLGTAKDNAEDMVKKGRARGWPRGVPMAARKAELRALRNAVHP